MFYNLFLHIKCNNGLVFNGIKTSLLYSVSASSTLSTTMTNNNRLIAFAIRSAMTRKLIQFYCATFCVGGCSRNFNLNFIFAPSELTQTQSATQSWPTWPNWTESTAASQVNLCVLHIACVTKSRTTTSELGGNPPACPARSTLPTWYPDTIPSLPSFAAVSVGWKIKFRGLQLDFVIGHLARVLGRSTATLHLPCPTQPHWSITVMHNWATLFRH